MKLGPFTLTALNAGNFKLDGGAMHGVVPKTLWSKLVSCDEQNRVDYSTTCLLIEGLGKKVLVETGNGAKWGGKESEIYGITPGAGIEGALAEVGVTPDAIDVVVMTHLHFDHAGGTTRKTSSATTNSTEAGFEPVFKNARHVIQRGEFFDATHPHERNRASYLAENFMPLEHAGLLDLKEGEADIIPGIRVLPTPGHTAHHQSILVEGDGERVLFLGDIVPTSVHVPLAWVMAYDLDPTQSVATKRALYDRAVDENWTVVFGHDTSCQAAKLARDDRGRVTVAAKFTLT